MKLSKKQIVAITFLVGLLLPILAWVIDLFRYDLEFSISGIIELHSINTAFWILDILPFLFAFAIHKAYDIWAVSKTDYEDLRNQLENQTINIKRVSSFAEKIGNGEYDSKFEITDKNDTLSKTIQNLRDKLYENNKQESIRNWMMVGKDKISNILRLHNDLNVLSFEVVVTIIKYLNVVQGAFYIYNEDNDKLKITASYAYNRKKYLNNEIKVGDGLVGQAAIEQDIVYRTEIPSNYLTITSGILGDRKPQSLLIVPLITEEKLQGALEFASFKPFEDVEINFLKEIGEIIARAIYNLKINEKTERLLRESQQMTAELRENEEKLRENAEEMRLTQEELEKTNSILEEKIQEVNRSQKRLHSLLENASELILIYNESKKLTYVSPSCKRMLGYDEEEMMNGKDFDRVNMKGQKILNQMFADLLKNPSESHKVEYTYLDKQGNIIYLESTCKNLLHDPAIKGLVLNTSDITERKRAEKEQRMRGQMQSLSENSPDLIIRIDINGQFFYANPIIEKYTGIKSEEFHKKHINEIGLNPDIVEFFNNTINEISSKKEKIEKEMDFNALHEERIMNCNAIPEFNEEKKLETILFVLHDITERKQIELMIQDKNQKITESINYALRIQQAILPNTKIIQKTFRQSFMFYKPKDVVSGDFPWFYEKGEDAYIAVIDCTGHGVPGAMLSLIGYFLTNQILGQIEHYNPGEILDQLHASVQRTLKQDQEGANARDGMDVALCKVNHRKKILEYAGAHRPLYYLHNGELQEFKGTKSAIGGIPKEGREEPKFENNLIHFEEGDSVFFFSDGLPDQFGGPEGKKYSPKRIREIIVQNQQLTMAQLNNFFQNDYRNWLGEGKQIDDVLLIGIKF